MDGKDIQLSVDSKVQFFAYQKLRDAVTMHKAKAGSVVVLDTMTGEVLALANYRATCPTSARTSLASSSQPAMTDASRPARR